MPIQSNDSSAKLALWNDEVFSCVWIAGTNVKQYARQAEKIDRELGIKTICEFVSKLVIHRTMPLDVNAKIVCGMSQIYLFNVKALHRSLQAVNEKDVRSRVDYNEKKIVRQFQQNITCKPGKDGWLPDTMDLEQLMNFELDNFMNQITEKEVIDCLLASQKNTTVQHIHDITLREMPDTTFPYSASNWQVEDDDFGTAEPNEMIDFFYPKVESNTTSSQLQPEQPIQLDQEHNLSVLNVVDCTYNDVASLGNTLPPLPAENDLTAFTEENATVEPSTTSAVNASVPVCDTNEYDVSSKIPVVEDHVEIVETKQTEGNENKDKNPRKRRLIVDAHTQISFNCYKRWISNDSLTLRDTTRNELKLLPYQQMMATDLFTKPMRSWNCSFMFERNAQTSRKRKANDSEFKSLKQRPKVVKAPAVPVVEPVPIAQSVLPIGDEPMITPCSWENPPRPNSFNKSDLQPNGYEGVITSATLMDVLRSYFATSDNDTVPFELLQSKMSNRQVAASTFGKLLALSGKQVIRMMKDENGRLKGLQKGVNWE